MKKTFKTLTALLATATLAFGLTACNDKEPVSYTHLTLPTNSRV